MTSFEISVVAPALVACLLVLSTHVPLGTEVLRRGIIFIDLAIAQVAGLGVIAAVRPIFASFSPHSFSCIWISRCSVSRCLWASRNFHSCFWTVSLNRSLSSSVAATTCLLVRI